MQTSEIQLPFELSFTNIPLHIKENYCCTVSFSNDNEKEHIHMGITYLEINEEYRIIEFDRINFDDTSLIDSQKWYKLFRETFYPIRVMVNTAGGIIEVCNKDEILNRIESLFKKLHSPHISKELQSELMELYKNFSQPENIMKETKEPFIQLVIFPVYNSYTESLKYFKNEYNIENEIHKYTYSAKLSEDLDELGHIKLEFIGLYNKNPNFHHDATYTFDPTTHVLQTLTGEIIQQNGNPVRFDITRLIAD